MDPGSLPTVALAILQPPGLCSCCSPGRMPTHTSNPSPFTLLMSARPPALPASPRLVQAHPCPAPLLLSVQMLAPLYLNPLYIGLCWKQVGSGRAAGLDFIFLYALGST